MSDTSKKKHTSSPGEIILQELRSKVESSLPGTRLPSENALAHKFNIARMTVTRAFRKLEQEGLIERRKGCGSFVKGMRNVTFFLPYPEFIVEQGYLAELFRKRLHGAIRASQDLRLKINIFPVLKAHDAPYDPQIFRDFPPSNLVIATSMIPETLQFLSEHKLRTVLFMDTQLAHGLKQYIYDWIILEKEHKKALHDAAEQLVKCGCGNIAVVTTGSEEDFAGEDIPQIPGAKIICKNISTPECGYDISVKLQTELKNFCSRNSIDGMIFNSSLPISGNTVNEYCGVPENIRITGMNILKEKCTVSKPFTFCVPQDDQMGYDAVKLLADAPRMGTRKKYEYRFENTSL